jgi:hypothetical protein
MIFYKSLLNSDTLPTLFILRVYATNKLALLVCPSLETSVICQILMKLSKLLNLKRPFSDLSQKVKTDLNIKLPSV